MRSLYALILSALWVLVACEKKPVGVAVDPKSAPAPAQDPADTASAPPKAKAAESREPAATVEKASTPAPTAQDREAAAARGAAYREGLTKKRALLDEEKATRGSLDKDKERAAGAVKDFLE